VIRAHPREREDALVPSRYEIRVNGRVSDELAGSLGLRADVRPVETTLSGDVRDRVELTSLLHRLTDLGLEVVELRQTTGTDHPA
jgi:hypothetical protein